MNRTYLLVAGLILLFALEIGRVYFIMPFPGSQRGETLPVAYFLHRNINWLRILVGILVLPAVYFYLGRGRLWQKLALGATILLYGILFYLFNFRFLADKIFYQPSHKVMATVSESKVDTNMLVIGTCLEGQAAAYPVEIIGYHHQVQDTVAGKPILVTYCTVCRTGRVFSPYVEGKFRHFRLVGMDHFNAMFEDDASKSWWRQSTGQAVAGPMTGHSLQELPSIQTRLGSWIRDYPATRILQPDTLYTKQYADLQGFDSGTIKSSLEKRDSSSWKFKSWVIGVQLDGRAKAYDWNQLLKERVISDSLGNTAIVLVLENDGASFHAWNRMVDGRPLQFEWNDRLRHLEDKNTHSVWDWNGTCIDGPLNSKKLYPVQVYQEFWHSWSSFHPGTLKVE